MEILKPQAEKLKRYFINADPFLWGILGAKNKKGCLVELKKSGFLQHYSDGSNPTYSKINQDLLVELGIDGILEHIVVPRVNSGFTPDVLRYLRRCWEEGQTPNMKYLTEHGLYRKWRLGDNETYERAGYQFDIRGVGRVYRVIGHRDPARLFVQIDTQHNFVERWTVFAGLWFEEIEPLLDFTQEGVVAGSNSK